MTAVCRKVLDSRTSAPCPLRGFQLALPSQFPIARYPRYAVLPSATRSCLCQPVPRYATSARRSCLSLPPLRGFPACYATSRLPSPASSLFAFPLSRPLSQLPTTRLPVCLPIMRLPACLPLRGFQLAFASQFLTTRYPLPATRYAILPSPVSSRLPATRYAASCYPTWLFRCPLSVVRCPLSVVAASTAPAIVSSALNSLSTVALSTATASSTLSSLPRLQLSVRKYASRAPFCLCTVICRLSAGKSRGREFTGEYGRF